MTQGSYRVGGESDSTDKYIPLMLEALAESQRIARMALDRMERMDQKEITNLHSTAWITPGEWVKERHSADKPKRFNNGGHFDHFCGEAFKRETGEWPTTRYPAMTGTRRTGEWVWRRGVETDRYLERKYVEYIRNHHPKQSHLSLMMKRPLESVKNDRN